MHKQSRCFYVLLQCCSCCQLSLSIQSCSSRNLTAIASSSTLRSGISHGLMASHGELLSSCLVPLFCWPLGRKQPALSIVKSRSRTVAIDFSLYKVHVPSVTGYTLRVLCAFCMTPACFVDLYMDTLLQILCTSQNI